MYDSKNADNAFNIKGSAAIWKKVDHGLNFRPNTLVLKKGLYDFNSFLVLISFFASIIGFMLLSMVPYDAFPHYQNEDGELVSTGFYLQSLFKVVILIVLGYTFGQSAITGTTKMFGRYLYVFSLGILVYGIAWSLQTSSMWWLHVLSYILIGLALFCFAYGVKCWFQHRDEVGDWKAIGDLVLQHDPFLPYYEGGLGDFFDKEPFRKHYFLIIKKDNEVKLYERRSIIPEPVYEEILQKKKMWLKEKMLDKKLDKELGLNENYQ